MNKIKIAHVQVKPILSGAQRVSLDILSGLQDEKYDKYIIFGCEFEVDNNFMNILMENNIKVFFIPSLKREIGLWDIKAIFALLSVFKEEKFDIIHTNSTKPGVVARFAAKLAGCKFVIHTVHGISYHKFEPLHKRFIYYFIESFFCLFSDRLVSVNNYYLKYYPFVKNKINIYNSYDFNNIPDKKIETKDKVCFGYMARLDKQKDPITFLKAIKYGVDNRFFNDTTIEVIVAGDGELSDKCLNYLVDNELQSIVSMIGWVIDKDDFYNNVDVLCQPSIYEAFGLVFIEAASYKIPSISTIVEGIPEVVIHNKTGFLVEPKDYISLSKSMKRYIDETNLIKEHGENALNYASDKFDKSKMIESYMSLYEKR